MKNLVLSVFSVFLLLFASASAATLELPEDVRIIEDDAFYGDVSVESVVFPQNLEEIHSRAFVGTSLSEIHLPDSLSFIAEDAFDGGLTVWANDDTYAYSWALDNGYETITDPDNLIDMTKYMNKSVYYMMTNFDLEDVTEEKSQQKSYQNGAMKVITNGAVPCKELISEIHVDNSTEPEYSLFGIHPGMTMGVAEETLLAYIDDEPGISAQETERRKWEYFRTDNSSGSNTSWGYQRFFNGEWQVVWLVGRYGCSRNSPLQKIEYCGGTRNLPSYRALLIGEVHTDAESYATRFKKSVNDLESALMSVNSGCFEITPLYSATYDDIVSSIDTVFGQADDNDVTILYITTHGEGGAAQGSNPGDLTVTGGRFMKLETIAAMIRSFRGTKVVIFDVCYAGRALEISAFRGEGMVVLTGGNIGEKTAISLFGTVNIFTQTLYKGIGTSGNMLADVNEPCSVVTVQELYRYVASHIEETRREWGTLCDAHTPQLISSNVKQPLFWR